MGDWKASSSRLSISIGAWPELRIGELCGMRDKDRWDLSSPFT